MREECSYYSSLLDSRLASSEDNLMFVETEQKNNLITFHLDRDNLYYVNINVKWNPNGYCCHD